MWYMCGMAMLVPNDPVGRRILVDDVRDPHGVCGRHSEAPAGPPFGMGSTALVSERIDAREVSDGVAEPADGGEPGDAPRREEGGTRFAGSDQNDQRASGSNTLRFNGNALLLIGHITFYTLRAQYLPILFPPKNNNNIDADAGREQWGGGIGPTTPPPNL